MLLAIELIFSNRSLLFALIWFKFLSVCIPQELNAFMSFLLNLASGTFWYCVSRRLILSSTRYCSKQNRANKIMAAAESKRLKMILLRMAAGLAFMWDADTSEVVSRPAIMSLIKPEGSFNTGSKSAIRVTTSCAFFCVMKCVLQLWQAAMCCMVSASIWPDSS